MTVSPTFSGRSAPPARWIPVLLGLLTAVGPISTDIYLPAFPSMITSLHTTLGPVEMTLSVWFIGLAIGQLTMGPLSDRYGRRLPLVAGNIIFAAASAVCAAAPDIMTFTVARFIASVGASASLVIPTACVRDIVTDRQQGARMMSKLVMIMGIVPILAPVLGSFVVQYVSWRVIFWASAVYGVICVLLVLKTLPESLPENMRSNLSVSSLISRYLSLLTHRNFVSHALISSFSTFMSFSYLTASSAVFVLFFHFTSIQFAMLFGLFSVFMIGASQINGYLNTRFDSGKILTASVLVSLTGATALLLISVLYQMYPFHDETGMYTEIVLVIGSMIIALGATGLIYPNATMGALEDHPHIAGSASALTGTMQYTFGSLAGFLIGCFPGNSPLSMAGGMFCGALMMFLLLFLRPSAPKSGS